MSIQQETWSFLRGKGLPEKSVAAAMGNIEAESEFDQSLIEKGSGVGFGLCQWSYERRTQLERYGTDLTHQLNFLWAELSGNTGDTGASPQWTSKSGYLSLPEFLSGNGSIADLTAAMCFCWERPNASVAHLDRRQTKAQEYFNQFTGTAPSANSNTSPSQAMEIPSTDYEVVKGSEQIGDALYGRRYRIIVSDSSGTAIDVSKLRCSFSIVKTIQMEPNYSEICIYNLNAQTENSIMLNANRVTVEAGYEGKQYGQIFDGDILQTIREKEDGTTYKLTIIALDSDRAINFDIANYSILKGQTSRQVVEHIISEAQYPISLGSISDALSNGGILSRGKVIFGKSSDYLRQIAQSHNAHYYTEDGKVNIVKMSDLPEGEIIDLNPTSGLIGTPQQTEYGISGQCLINPQVKVNTLIHIDNSLVRAMQIDINGSNTTNTIPAGGGSTDARNKIIAKAKEIVQKCADGKARYEHPSGSRQPSDPSFTANGIEYYDCSVLVEVCYTAAGLKMPPPSGTQWDLCKNGGIISTDFDKLRNEGKPGDLLFNGANGSQHVAIYDGNGGQYAAHGHYGDARDISHSDSISGQFMYWGRSKELANTDSGQSPSVPSAATNTTTNTAATNTTSTTGNTTNTTSNTDTTSQYPPFRSLDKDGIYRIIKTTTTGDTRGNDWTISFETITQAGGAIPIVSS